jgi:hypothetical protein
VPVYAIQNRPTEPAFFPGFHAGAPAPTVLDGKRLG